MALLGVYHGALLLWILAALVCSQSISNLSTTLTTSTVTITSSTVSSFPTDTTSTTSSGSSSSTITIASTSSTTDPITSTSTSVSTSTISESVAASSTSIAPIVPSSSAISSISAAVSSLESSLSLTSDSGTTSASVFTTTPPPTTFTTSSSSVILSTSTFLSTYVAPVSTGPNGSPSFTTITSVITGVSSSTTVLQLTSASTPGAALATSSAGGPGSSLSTGAKAGIGVGAAIIAIAAIALAVWLSMCCRKRRRSSISESDRYPPTPVPAMAAYLPAKKQPSELSSSPPMSPGHRSPIPVSPQHAHSWGSGSVSEMYQSPIQEEQERHAPAYQSPTLGADGYWGTTQELPAGTSAPPQGVYRGTEMEVPLHQQSSRPIVPKGVWPPSA